MRLTNLCCPQVDLDPRLQWRQEQHRVTIVHKAFQTHRWLLASYPLEACLDLVEHWYQDLQCRKCP